MIVSDSELDLQRGLDYIGVTVVFFCHDGEGNLLLHKRSENCRDENGLWDCGGGSMEFGETFEDAVEREVKEEYSVMPLEIKSVATTNVIREHNGKMTHWIAHIHVVKVPRDGVAIGEPDKMDEIGWFSPYDLPENQHSCLEKHLELTKKHINPR
jgi:8-oxo-dGTP diphosphatase